MEQFVPPAPSMNRPPVDESKIEALRAKVGAKLNKWADRITISMAYIPQVKRVEGERWTQNGKQWEMKGGVPMTISKFQDARMPHWCPKCSLPMNHRFDRKFYNIRGWCYNCNVEFDNDLVINGTFEQFHTQAARANEVSYLKDKIQEHLDYITGFKEPQVHFEDGRYEILATRDQFQSVFDDLMKDVELCVQRLEQIKQEEQQEETNGQDTTTVK